MRRTILLVTAMAAALVVAGGVALAATTVIRCSTDPCLGTDERNELIGTSNSETIKALAGDDRVIGNYGEDIIYGGKGIDGTDGHRGDDTIYGGRGDDGTGWGGKLKGAEDSDIIYGGAGNDTIDAEKDDRPSANPRAPIDYSLGQSGNDTIYANDGNRDLIDCGENRRDKDTVYYDEELDTIINCEVKNPTTPSSTASVEEEGATRTTEQGR